MTFLRNAWYVAAHAPAVTRQPIRRVMLGEPVVFYRTEAGEVVALADRCPHRFAPLHSGRLRGDHIECLYHGLRFDRTGACVHNPHGDHKIPPAAKVRPYAVAERDNLVWLWMGDADQADPALLPDHSGFLGHGTYTPVVGEYVLDAHYELVLDNLLDLSHAPFLHPDSLASPESINTLRVEMKQEGNTVWVYHWAPDGPPSAQFKPFWPADVPHCDTHAHMRWDPPCNLQLDVGVTALGRPESEGLYLRFLHLLAPIDDRHTRYLWIAARNFALDIEPVSQAMQKQIEMAFENEDEPIIAAVQDNMGTHDLFSLSPVLLPGDAGGVRARRILGQLLQREAAATTSI